MSKKDTRLRVWGLRIALVSAGLYALAGAILFAWGGFAADPAPTRGSMPGTGAVAPSPPAFPIRADAGNRRGLTVLSRGRSSLPEGIVFPVRGEHRLTRSFGDPRGGDRSHRGVDIMAEKGTPVVAAADGVVQWMFDEVGGDCCHVALRHENGWQSRYIHLNNDTPGTDDGHAYGIAPGLAVGVEVRQGQLVGWVGDSGNAEGTGSHLHFELVRPDGEPLDPHEILLAALGEDDPDASAGGGLVRR